MEISDAERLILSNQYRILERLYPDEASDFAIAREIIECGYEHAYGEISQHIVEPLPEREGAKVVQIMAMFRILKDSYSKLKQKPQIEEWLIQFDGFDGNSETKHMAYARFIVNEQKGFQELKADARDNFNSHAPNLDKFERMLREWEASKSKYHLSAEDIVRIANA